MLNNFLYVFLGGGMGSVARFSISMMVTYFFKNTFPLATIFSNVLSCLVLGISLMFLSDKINTEHTFKLLILTGFCGGFSTFSAFSFETISLLKQGSYQYAALNILLNITLCFGIIWLMSRSKA